MECCNNPRGGKPSVRYWGDEGCGSGVKTFHCRLDHERKVCAQNKRQGISGSHIWTAWNKGGNAILWYGCYQIDLFECTQDFLSCYMKISIYIKHWVIVCSFDSTNVCFWNHALETFFSLETGGFFGKIKLDVTLVFHLPRGFWKHFYLQQDFSCKTVPSIIPVIPGFPIN